MTQYAWWQAAVSGERGPINQDDPQSGFYETRSKNKQTGEVTLGVIAYWRDEHGKLCCRLGADRMLDETKATERWPYAAKLPIPHQTYKSFLTFGRFPDENEAAARDRANSQGALDLDSFESVKDRIEDLSREAEALIKKGAAKTAEQSDRAADLADRLRKLEVKADDLRKSEKKPHDDAAKAVDKKWNPIRDRAAANKDLLKRAVVTPFLVAEKKKAEAEQAKAVQTGEPAPAPVRTVAGTTGRAALRESKSAKITDYAKALAYFANNEKVRDLIQSLANAAVRQGTCPDGCEVLSEDRAA